MKTDIILAGVGGQGILSIATVLGIAALEENLYLKQAEVHGMSQRGGDVQSNLRISDSPIASDLIKLGGADLIVSLEPMEGLRYLPFLKKNGWLITNSVPFINIVNYPSEEILSSELKKVENSVVFDMDQLAKEAGSPKASNMILLGAASPFIELSADSMRDGIKELFLKKGEKIAELNIKAFELGRKKSEEILKEKK